MPVKIRLQRQGKKGKPYFHIVIADSRAPRDGKFIERIGSYNPNTNPATIEINFDGALNWLQKGAQPSDTCRAILSYKGILYKNHLMNGVKKGAFSEEEAEKRFQEWMKEKEGKVQAKIDKLSKAVETDIKERLEAEAKVNEKRVEQIAKRNSELAEEVAKAEAEKKGKVAPVETPAAEATEVKEEAPAEEKAEATEEKKAEVPKAEEPKAEAPAEEAKEGATKEEKPQEPAAEKEEEKDK